MLLLNHSRCADLLLNVMVYALPVPAQDAKSPFARAVDLLSGEWLGEAAGSPGQGSGGFSLRPEHPAAAGKPAFHHKDLLLIYQETGTEPMRAFYF